jgi:hypothetical protein
LQEKTLGIIGSLLLSLVLENEIPVESLATKSLFKLKLSDKSSEIGSVGFGEVLEATSWLLTSDSYSSVASTSRSKIGLMIIANSLNIFSNIYHQNIDMFKSLQ